MLIRNITVRGRKFYIKGTEEASVGAFFVNVMKVDVFKQFHFVDKDKLKQILWANYRGSLNVSESQFNKYWDDGLWAMLKHEYTQKRGSVAQTIRRLVCSYCFTFLYIFLHFGC